MRVRDRIARGLLLATVLGSSLHGAQAQDTPNLPGGASSLTETHGDWVVSCAIRDVGGKSAKLCALSQDQKDGKTGQRILHLELQPKDDQAEGTLILPFGLALAEGVTLQIDDGEATAPQPFSTCLPTGCLVPVKFSAQMMESLMTAKQLKLAAKSSGTAGSGNRVEFTASLKGFEAALKRTSELLQ